MPTTPRGVFPDWPGRRSLRNWLADERRRRRSLRVTAQDLAPPPSRAWAAFGHSTIVPPARVVNPDRIHIGDGVRIEENVWFSVVRPFPDVEPRVVVGDDVRIGRCSQFAIAGELIIGRGAFIGDFAMILDTIHPYEVEDRLPVVTRPLSVRIGEDSILGTHVVVLPGVTIGAGARVAHHSVVGRDVAPGDYVAGYPARRRPA